MVGQEFLQFLKEHDLLNTALRKGWVSTSLNNYRHIKEFYDEEMKVLKDRGNNDYKMQALQNSCEKFSCQKDKIYKALKVMNS